MPRQLRAHSLPLEQTWALDVRDGARVLWETDQEKLRRNWAAALDHKTKMWPRRGGLTRERWRLWGERLRGLSREEGKWDVETRVVVMEAAEVIENILEDSN